MYKNIRTLVTMIIVAINFSTLRITDDELLI